MRSYRLTKSESIRRSASILQFVACSLQLIRKDPEVNQNWHGTLIRHMLLLITVCLLVGLISGYYGWSLALSLIHISEPTRPY